MKIRSGFVSNSSSSSFVVLATAEAHKRAMEQLTGDERQCVNAVLDTVDAFGQKMVYMAEVTSMDVSSHEPEYLDLPEGLEEDFWDARDKWINLVTADSKDGVHLGVG